MDDLIQVNDRWSVMILFGRLRIIDRLTQTLSASRNSFEHLATCGVVTDECVSILPWPDQFRENSLGHPVSILFGFVATIPGIVPDKFVAGTPRARSLPTGSSALSKNDPVAFD